MRSPSKTIFARFWMRVAQWLAPLSGGGISFRILAFLKAGREQIPGVDLLRARIRIRQGKPEEAVEMLKEEVRLFPENSVAAELLMDLQASLPSRWTGRRSELADVLPRIVPHTMLSPERLEALFQGARRICQEDRQGNFVECGVAAGGSSALLAWVIKKYSRQPRLLFCFDTFRGMPEPTSRDTHQGRGAQNTGWGAGTCAAPLGSLMALAESLGVSEIIQPVPGLFQDTLPANKGRIGPIALLHLDGDWYESTRAILENLYDQATASAYFQVDDYGHWEGCRQAVNEFEKSRGCHFLLRGIDGTGVWFLKP